MSRTAFEKLICIRTYRVLPFSEESLPVLQNLDTGCAIDDIPRSMLINLRNLICWPDHVMKELRPDYTQNLVHLRFSIEEASVNADLHFPNLKTMILHDQLESEVNEFVGELGQHLKVPNLKALAISAFFESAMTLLALLPPLTALALYSRDGCHLNELFHTIAHYHPNLLMLHCGNFPFNWDHWVASDTTILPKSIGIFGGWGLLLSDGDEELDVVHFLQSPFAQQLTTIQDIDDWHEHDGSEHSHLILQELEIWKGQGGKQYQMLTGKTHDVFIDQVHALGIVSSSRTPN